MTLVRPSLQFGVAMMDGDATVTGFREKPRSEHWVNGGFFCFEPGVLDYLDDSSVLERAPLEGLAADGELHGVPPHRLLGVHGHLQGRRRVERRLGGRRRALEALGLAQ